MIECIFVGLLHGAIFSVGILVGVFAIAAILTSIWRGNRG